MRKRRVSFEIMTGMLLLSFMLAGCGSLREEAREQRENPIMITILAGQSTSDAGVEDMIEEKIMKEIPGIELEWECVDWGENFDSRLCARLASGDAPDIIIGKAQDVKTYFGTGQLAEVNKEWMEGIEKESLESVTIDGKYYGIPFNAWYQGVIYHKKIFRELELTVPETKEELLYVIKVLEEHGITPFASHYMESWKAGNTTMQFMLNEVFIHNPQWGDEFRKGKQGFAGNEIMEMCLGNNQDILEHSWEDALFIDQFTCDSRFEKGEAAMYLTGSWSLQFANQYAGKGDYGIFPYPNSTGDARLIRETNMTFMKSASTRHPETVERILETIIGDKELRKEIQEFTQTYPVLKNEAPGFESCIQEDIDYYEKEGRIIEAASGNSQLIWPFQNDVSVQLLLWLQGKQELEDVLEYADEHRGDSIG